MVALLAAEPAGDSTYDANSPIILRALALRSAFPTPRPFISLCHSTTRELCSHTLASPPTECTKVHFPEPLPPQWINADLRVLDVSTLGKFHVVVADPPWAIHQELPYGTLTDDEMMQMPVGSMQDEGGLLFLWVTGRAMELGRECLAAWGYERIDELIWIKTNQLQGLIRTGRTGHWLNHSKEHCLVAIRRSPTNPTLSPALPSWCQKGLDTQVLLAEVRETSRKPDELYDMVERILGGKGKGRKLELFGRTHNLRDGWLTLGNQFGKSNQVFEEEVVRAFNERYPETYMQLLDPKSVSNTVAR
ncbi:hypothetical protein RQP46_008770 [Phenoliferia psychrophenolica]